MDNKTTKTYSKTQLADLYKIDVRTLRKWIKNNNALIEELKSVGYKIKQRSFTPLQVKTIFKHLGQP